jgi:hypothetical protein
MISVVKHQTSTTTMASAGNGLECTYVCNTTQSRCTHVGRFDHYGRRVCKSHLECLRRREECAICLESMTPSTCRRLECGHYFHAPCIAGMAKPECPVCRTPMSIRVCLDVFHETHLEAIVTDLIFQPPSIQPTTIETYDMINSITALGGETQAHYINYLVRIYMQLLSVPGVMEDNTCHELINAVFQLVHIRATAAV